MLGQELEKQLQAGVQSLSQDPGSVGTGIQEELKAIVTTVCRSYSRRLAQGRAAPPSSHASLREEVTEQLRSRVLDEEALLDASDWADLLPRLLAPPNAPQPAPPAHAPAPAAPAAAAPLASAPPAATAADKAAVLAELRQLFPSHSAAALAEAARRAADLEGAVFEVLSAARPRDDPPSAQADAAPALAPPPPPAAAGERRAYTTAGVSTGACSFGLCFDVAAKGRAVRVTGLRTASSPGLNWGQGQPLRVAVYATRAARSGRGAELDSGEWRRVGGGAAVSLPMVSWADRAPEYGAVPLDEPVEVPAGGTRGLLVHTNDLYGLVTGVAGGAGGTDEALGNDDDGPEPLRPGVAVGGDEFVELRAGYTIGAAVFEEFDGVALPSAGAFVGVLEYEVL